MESVKFDIFASPFFLFTVVIGVSVLLLMYLISMFKNPEGDTEKAKSEKSTGNSEKRKDPAISGKRKKKVPESRWIGKHDKHNFSHPWLLASLKGHTANILDMDFSSNGKYLASCDDEDPDPGGEPIQLTTTQDLDKENLPAEPNPSPKGLSRRQRKNRRREDTSPPEKPKKSKPKKSLEGTPVLTKKQIMSSVPLKQYTKFNSSEKVFIQFLQNYLLTLDQMMVMGYPIQSSLEPTLVVIYKNPRVPIFPNNKTVFDVNAREFVPKNDWSSNDSGQGSGSSSDSGENFDSEESSSDQSSSDQSSSDQSSSDQSSSDQSNSDQSSSDQDSTTSSINESYLKRTCTRCTRSFYTTTDKYITSEKCSHHWGKVSRLDASARVQGKPQLAYACCQGKIGSKGCTESKLHVWSGIHVGMNGLYDDFILTKQRKNPRPDGNNGVYALDCEMCYSVRGLVLTKVTVVGMDGRLVYDSFVKPEEEIVDYNTRFSGITAKDMKRNPTKTLSQVQNDLMGFIKSDTILIGHGLENDLRALKLVHYMVVDTAHSFPHFNGLPYRRSLRNLTESILKRKIQTSANGHNSYEDATACMELMLWRVRKDFRRVHLQY